MLTLEKFACGVSGYLDDDGSEDTSKIHVKIQVGELSLTAQLDTAAPWCVLSPEIAKSCGLLSTSDGHHPVERSRFPVSLSTRIGRVSGRLERLLITFEADEGTSLDVECSVFVSPDWTGPNFLGYGGCLERVRFAVDPARNRFYFGPLSD